MHHVSVYPCGVTQRVRCASRSRLIDPKLLELAAKVSGSHTKREAIERALRVLIQEDWRAHR